MQYAQLGKSGLIVSRICFGCWQLSPRFWGEVAIGPWRKALDKAVELGVNFVDTAGAYGDGYAEEMLGGYFQDSGNREHFVLATKFYWTFKKAQRHPDTSYAFIIQECEDALRRLKTDYIDLFQVHAWDPLTRPDEVAAALGRLQQEGKVRLFGVSNLNVEQMALYLRYVDIASLQPLYNMIDREAESRELPFCLRERVGVITYSSLHRGLLTGKYTRDTRFDDDRRNLALYQGRAFHSMIDALDALRPLAEKHNLTVAQFSIRWLLTHPAVTSAIVGIKTPEHIASIVPAADGALPAEDWHEAARVIAEAKREALRLS